MRIRESIHPAYFDIHFLQEVPVLVWPNEFVIVTAFATTGEVWTTEEFLSART